MGQSSTASTDVVTVTLLLEQLQSRFTLLKENSMTESGFISVSEIVQVKSVPAPADAIIVPSAPIDTVELGHTGMSTAI